MELLQRRRRWLRRLAIALGVLEAGCFLVSGMRFRDTPLTILAPVLVLVGAWIASREPLIIAGLLLLFATLVMPISAAVAAGDQSMDARFYSAVVTVTCIPLLAAILLYFSGRRSGPSPPSKLG